MNGAWWQTLPSRLRLTHRPEVTVWHIVTLSGVEIRTACEPFVEFLYRENRIAVLAASVITDQAQQFLLHLADVDSSRT